MNPIKLYYSEALIRQTVRSYWWKQIGPIFIVVLIFLSILTTYRIINGDRTWYVGMFSTIIILGFATMVGSYIIQLQRSLKRFKRMKTPEATFEFGEDRFKVSSDIGSSEIEWALISKILCFKNAWVLIFSGSDFMTLPTSELSDEIKEKILLKARKNGAKFSS